MFDDSDMTLDCQTCVAANTTACNDCVVSHVLANDDGPIELVVSPLEAPVSAADRAVSLFAKAGLLDDPVVFVPIDQFEQMSAGAHVEVG